MMKMFRLLIHGARQIVQVVSEGQEMVTGKGMKTLSILEGRQGSEEGYSIAIDNEGKIAAIGTDEEVKDSLEDVDFEKTINAKGKSIIPGLIDGHTHAVWAGDRVHEFAMKLQGASYIEVHKAGGGIMFTVDQVRKASEDQLYKDLKSYLQKMVEAGTTMVEVKSGYGLDKNTEVKMLKVIERARNDPEVHTDISTTYCGAHAVPKGSTADEATQDILNVQLPYITSLMKAGSLHVDNIDVFCEKGVFDVDNTGKILEAGKNAGMAINFHAEELSCLHSAEMGAELGARAISHLEEVSDEGIRKMAQAKTVAVILPTTAYILRLKSPPVRQMIDSGVPVTLGTDFNPNAHCLSMPLVMHLACVLFKMSMDEALMASTINAAASLGKSTDYGSLEVGKWGDLLILNSPRWEHIIYQMGSHQYVIKHVIKSGHVVHTNSC